MNLEEQIEQINLVIDKIKPYLNCLCKNDGCLSRLHDA